MLSRVAEGVCRGMGALADCRVPGMLLKPAMRVYSVSMGVRMEEAEIPEEGFACFGDFFARRLKEGARPVCADSEAVVSPCDGRLVAVHQLSGDAQQGLVVKGYNYDLERLLGESVGDRYAGGVGGVVYLHPRDYHRVHVPMSGSLHRVRHIAGARFPVARWSESRIRGLYEKNERMVFHFEVDGGHMAVVMVAAFGVGHIDTPYGPGRGRHVAAGRTHAPPVALRIGDELGAFRLGSTVVMLWSADVIDGLPDVGRLVFGQRIARQTPRSAG